MMPVIYPEDCTPGSWQSVQPACDRGSKWHDQAPPPAVADPKQRRSFCIQVCDYRSQATHTCLL